MRAMIIGLAVLAAACAPPQPREPAGEIADAQGVWAVARAEGVVFRAIGQEPGWLLDIYADRPMQLQWDYGERRAAFPPVAATAPAPGVTRYEAEAEGRRLIVTIRDAPCQDVMSGEPFPATVEVAIDGRTLSGCGRPL